MEDCDMKNSFKKIIWALTFTTLCIGLLTINSGCKKPTDNTTDNTSLFWHGEEQVDVDFGSATVTVNLHGMRTSIYEGTVGVRLSDIVKKAKLATTAELADYYFNFIASDAFDMSIKAKQNAMSLPTWDDMQKGYLYDSGSSSGLTIKWETGTPPGDFGRFYNCKLMDGGIIQILEDNVL